MGEHNAFADAACRARRTRDAQKYWSGVRSSKNGEPRDASVARIIGKITVPCISLASNTQAPALKKEK
jgi:hypothetical protein